MNPQHQSSYNKNHDEKDINTLEPKLKEILFLKVFFSFYYT